MTVTRWYEALNERIPPSLSCEWDHDGLMCCPRGAREVRRILITLDVTAEAVDYAVREGYDVILSHHPMIFRGLPFICQDHALGAKAIRLIENGIAVMSFHTRLDAVQGGVNDVLAELLGLQDVEPFGDEGIGRIGTLAREESPRDFALRVKALLGAPSVTLSDAGKQARRVAVLGGSGKDDVTVARDAGADTFVSGELGYHDMVDAPEEGMNLLFAGHFYTEQPVCSVLEKMAREIDPSVDCHIFDCNRIQTL